MSYESKQAGIDLSSTERACFGWDFFGFCKGICRGFSLGPDEKNTKKFGCEISNVSCVGKNLKKTSTNRCLRPVRVLVRDSGWFRLVVPRSCAVALLTLAPPVHCPDTDSRTNAHWSAHASNITKHKTMIPRRTRRKNLWKDLDPVAMKKPVKHPEISRNQKAVHEQPETNHIKGWPRFHWMGFVWTTINPKIPQQKHLITQPWLSSLQFVGPLWPENWLQS